MKLCTRHLMLLSVMTLLFVGCSGDGGQTSAENTTVTGTTPTKTESQPPAAPPDAAPPDAGPAAADLDDPAPGTAVAQSGDPGSIQGAVKSRYVALAQGAVYIVRVDGQEFPPPEEHAKMDQKNLIFLPHILPVVVGTTVEFPNSDTVRHNVFSKDPNIFSEDPAAEPFNLGTYDVGVVKQETSHNVGIMHLGCNVHTEMSAYILVCQNPYFDVTDKGTGKFVIPDVPPGKWHLRLFHEKLKPKTILVEVKPGEDVSVDFTDLERK